MTPFYYLSPGGGPSSMSFPPEDDQQQLQLFLSPPSSSLITARDPRASLLLGEPEQYDQYPQGLLYYGNSSRDHHHHHHHHPGSSSSFQNFVNGPTNDSHKLLSSETLEDNKEHREGSCGGDISSQKWIPSKMRLMQKTMSSSGSSSTTTNEKTMKLTLKIQDQRYRHVVVSQILELGIVSHSVIIGLSLGVSQSPCTIRPLIAALSFHQFFEGFALGGCISQAQFKTTSTLIMACFFALTTPTGIGIGIAIASFYNPNSPGALIAEGILDSLSAGILVYMALVDLIAADFLSKRMSCNFRLQLVSYCLLFLGAGLMSALAIWA